MVVLSSEPTFEGLVCRANISSKNVHKMYTNCREQDLNLSCQQHLHAFVQAVELDPHVKELPQARAHWNTLHMFP